VAVGSDRHRHTGRLVKWPACRQLDAFPSFHARSGWRNASYSEYAPIESASRSLKLSVARTGDINVGDLGARCEDINGAGHHGRPGVSASGSITIRNDLSSPRRRERPNHDRRARRTGSSHCRARAGIRLPALSEHQPTGRCC